MTAIFAQTITVYLIDVHPIVREDLARAIGPEDGDGLAALTDPERVVLRFLLLGVPTSEID